MCGGNKEEKWFDKRLVWKIGEGKSTRFWHDNPLLVVLHGVNLPLIKYETSD